MNTIGYSTAVTIQLPETAPQRGLVDESNSSGAGTPRPGEFQATRLADEKNEELRKQFTQFVGEAFFGQMIKAMRSTVGKAAYFDGGRAEEIFQGQMDQKLAENLTETSAERFAEPMFERQFPQFAKQTASNDLEQLATLQRK